jgi:hypothetical protein
LSSHNGMVGKNDRGDADKIAHLNGDHRHHRRQRRRASVLPLSQLDRTGDDCS